MCGIAGIADFRSGARPDPGLLASMTETLQHRGPDASCVVTLPGDAGPRLGFGFRRLGIVDLGAGARAYADESGALRAICNGEIYNEPELRRELLARDHRFETGCDTEVIPHLYEEHGLGFVDRLNGMFAFALFDARAPRLVLGRDRAGEKPLYYAQPAGEILFASEIKALLAHPDVSREPDHAALRRYLLYGYFPAPYTPFRAIRKLPAAHLLVAERGRIRIEPYWDLRRHLRPAAEAGGRAAAETGGRARAAAESPDIETAAREVRRRLDEAVRLRLRADVEVGVLFSGGVDSSAIAALAIDAAGRPLPTFTVALRDPDFDEGAFARRAAAHLGTEHHEMVAGEPEMLQGLVEMARLLDEPLADSSVVPTYLLSRFARGRVKVALGGEGGDELFAGYPTYLGHRLAQFYMRLPRAARALLRSAVGRLPPAFDNVGLGFLLKKFVSAAERPPLERHLAWFGAIPPEAQTTILSDAALAEASRLDPGDDPADDARRLADGLAARDPLDAILGLDFLMFLQDDLLTKVDRASMAASLEVRAPFLHHPLVEYAAGLPAGLKLRGATSKFILKRAVGDRLTREIVSRRKRGFNIPIARLMHGGLQPLLRRALDPLRLRRAGLLRPEAVTGFLEAHLARRADHGRLLWTLLMLQLWHSRHYEGGDLLDAPPPSLS